jgi:hypothetical protein
MCQILVPKLHRNFHCNWCCNWHEGTGTANLGFYEETLISQFKKFADMIQGRDALCIGDLLSGFSKCSMSLIMGEIEDLPSCG